MSKQLMLVRLYHVPLDAIDKHLERNGKLTAAAAALETVEKFAK